MGRRRWMAPRVLKAPCTKYFCRQKNWIMIGIVAKVTSADSPDQSAPSAPWKACRPTSTGRTESFWVMR